VPLPHRKMARRGKVGGGQSFKTGDASLAFRDVIEYWDNENRFGAGARTSMGSLRGVGIAWGGGGASTSGATVILGIRPDRQQGVKMFGPTQPGECLYFSAIILLLIIIIIFLFLLSFIVIII